MVQLIWLHHPFLPRILHPLRVKENGTTQLDESSISAKDFASFEGLRSMSNLKVASFAPLMQNSSSFRGLIVKDASVVSPKYTSIKPLGDRVPVTIKDAKEKSVDDILLPTSAQSNPQGGGVVVVGKGNSIGKTTVEISVKLIL